MLEFDLGGLQSSILEGYRNPWFFTTPFLRSKFEQSSLMGKTDVIHSHNTINYSI